MRVLLIGGSGHFSQRIAERAVRTGHEVMLLARGQRQLVEDRLPVRWLHADRAALREQATALAAFAPELVVDSICFSAVQADDLVALFGSARRVVLISSVDVYGEDIGAMPVDETRPPLPVTPYARHKLAAERRLLAGLGPRATVFRPSHILGRGFLTTSLWGRSPHLVDRIRRGLAVPAIDGGCNLVTPVHAADIARWVLDCVDNPAADGEVFNAVGACTHSQRDYYAAIAQVLGVPLRLHTVPSAVFGRHVATPTQFNWHRPYSSAKVQQLLGVAPAGTLASMMAETVQHMLAHGLVRDCREHPLDDRLIDLLLRHERELGELLTTRS